MIASWSLLAGASAGGAMSGARELTAPGPPEVLWPVTERGQGPRSDVSDAAFEPLSSRLVDRSRPLFP